MKFIQISDLHIVPPGGILYGLDPEKRLRECLADIEEKHAAAECIMITGDLADKGDEVSYAHLKAIIETAKLPIHILIGNHDRRPNFLKVFTSAETDPNGFVQFTVDTSAGRFIGLDTNDDVDRNIGVLCEKRLEWLSRELERAAGMPVYIFMHHPPFAVGIKKMDTIGLQNVESFADVVTGRDNVRHIFFGHLHRPISGSWRGIPFSFLPAMNHQVALDFVIEERVPGSHEPPAYGVVFVEADSTVVHLHNFLDRTGTFNL